MKIDAYQFSRKDRLAHRNCCMGRVEVLVANRYLAEEYVIQSVIWSLELLWVKIHRQPENLHILRHGFVCVWMKTFGPTFSSIDFRHWTDLLFHLQGIPGWSLLLSSTPLPPGE